MSEDDARNAAIALAQIACLVLRTIPAEYRDKVWLMVHKQALKEVCALEMEETVQ